MQLNRLDGKTAIVTGGGSGIGRAICQIFAKEGARVAIADVNEIGADETLISLARGENQKHVVVKVDVSNSEDVKRVFATSMETLGGKYDILVNCAGITTAPANFGELPEKKFDDIMNVNFKGTYLMAKEFVTSLKNVEADVRGSLVNISSIDGRVGREKHAEYSASKAAVISLTKSIANGFPENRIRANCILPGMVDTPLLHAIGEDLVKTQEKNIPMGRRGQPEEIANACLFLVSEESSYVNGACLSVSGGL